MSFTNKETIVTGMENNEVTQVRRIIKFTPFFKTEWWQTISTKSLGNDIHITTDHPIENIYLNGKKI